MRSQAGQHIITMNILPNISRSEGNQAMKIGHLIEYNIENISSSKMMQKMRRAD